MAGIWQGREAVTVIKKLLDTGCTGTVWVSRFEVFRRDINSILKQAGLEIN